MAKKILKFVILPIIILMAIFAGYLFIGRSKPVENIVWGMNFSQKQAESLGVPWKENYTALLADMGVRNLKVAAYWDLLEPEEGKYNFDDLDWQISEAEKYNAKILLVMGIKCPRWPECHIPGWASKIGRLEQQNNVLNLIEKIVLRYKDSSAIWAWQVENEPFFLYGECTWIDEDLLKQEIAKVKLLDSKGRPVVISDSGEGSFWFRAAEFGDIVGTTMYKKVWFTTPGFIKKNLEGMFLEKLGFYFDYFFPPVFYQRKAQLIEKFFGKKVICVELQAEPFGPKVIYESSIEEQAKSMDLEQFKKNIEFAKQTGLSEFYLWGGEWMYWMKTTQNNPDIWNEAKRLFTP